ncbi:6473_t:CDS:1, partial [Paraglomus brasilianum]
ASPILPWGICQNWCLRKQVKESLKEKYPKYIPLVDPVDGSIEVRQRIAYLETFLKDYVIEVDVLEETENVDEGDNALTAAEKDELATGSRRSLTPGDDE